MSIDIKKHLRREPQTYRNLEIYPILLLDTDIYEIFLETMCIPKEYIPNKSILKMSYLKYLLFFVQGSYTSDGIDIDVKEKLTKLLKYVTRKEVYIKQIIDDILESDIEFHYEIYIDDVTYHEYDFDMMRGIILEQNGKSIEYIESFNPELEKSLSFFFRNQGGSTSLYHRILIYSAISNIDISDMVTWTITEFEIKEDILKKYEEWKIYRPLESSGQIEVKSPNKIDNPFEYREKSKDRYESILINADSFERDLKQFAQ